MKMPFQLPKNYGSWVTLADTGAANVTSSWLPQGNSIPGLIVVMTFQMSHTMHADYQRD